MISLYSGYYLVQSETSLIQLPLTLADKWLAYSYCNSDKLGEAKCTYNAI